MRIRLLSVRPRIFPLPLPGSRVALLAPSLTVLAALAALILLAQTGYVATAGYRLRSLEHLRTVQQHDIQELQADIASLTSLARVQQVAKNRWNMAAPPKLVYLKIDVAPANAGSTGMPDSPSGE